MALISTTMAALVGLLVALGVMTLVWVSSLLLRDASLVDRYWGAGFVLLAWVYWVSAGAPIGGLLMVLPVTLWGSRLSLYLTWRNWGHGEDYRYQAMRLAQGRRFPWISLVTVFLLQGVLMWIIAMPVMVGARIADPGAAVVWLLLPGLLCWLVGLIWESVADFQLARFKAEPGNKGAVMDRGLWRYCRHPNYFGEILLWWGFALMAASVGGWWTLASAGLITFLIARVSGVTLLEKGLKRKRPAYRDYMARTNALIPGAPQRKY